MRVVNIYCYLIKYRVKQKYLLPFHVTNHKLINIIYIYIYILYINIKNRTCYYFHDIIKIENFNLVNILIDEKSYENILVYNISYKTLIDAKPLRIRLDELEGLLEFMMELDI